MTENPDPKPTFIERIAEVPAGEWNKLVPRGYPFLRHEFLAALEEHGCLGERTGWFPHHLLAFAHGGRLAGAVPLYLRTNSYGEFVFDWAWAAAYERHDIPYYPKLVCAVPFTPATGPRILVDPHGPVEEVQQRLVRHIVEEARQLGVSGIHWLFTTEKQAELIEGESHLIRTGCQFHWENAGYQSFDDYLAGLSAKKRKNVRQERRRVADAGLKLESVTGDGLDSNAWEEVHRLYARNARKRGGYPYLTADFFRAIGEAMPEQVVVTSAFDGERRVAAAICLRSEDTLYGRHWGAARQFDALHFEACYYQGIEYAIRHGLKRFDPGAQGEHKVSRGFLPTLTYSAHWLAHPQFRRAVADFLARETPAIRGYASELAAHSPYKKSDAIQRAVSRPA